MKPILYRCNVCGKVVLHDCRNLWKKSWCEETGKDARLYRVNKPKKEAK